jgi:hypothetical protein
MQEITMGLNEAVSEKDKIMAITKNVFTLMKPDGW